MPTNRETKIEIVRVSKIFSGTRRVHALEDINLSIRENEFLVLVGPSGCGKSTLLNIIAGFIRPTTGKVLLEGKEVIAPGPDRGFVFQQFALFPWKTVYKNLEFGLKLRGIPKQKRKEVVEKYLKVVNLYDFKDSYPIELSGGMQQRVAVARVYANNPEVMLMDEPFGALDEQTRDYMEQFLIRLWAKERKTVIYVTHNLDEAIFLGERVVVMGTRPGLVKAIIDIKRDGLLPSNRYTPDIKLSEKFIDLKRELWELLKPEFLRALEREELM